MYYANFNANNGTRLINDVTDSGKNRIIKDIREMAEGERFNGNECRWYVWTIDGDGGRTCIAAGGMTRGGRRYRISSNDLLCI